jgi:hypothetical protein
MKWSVMVLCVLLVNADAAFAQSRAADAAGSPEPAPEESRATNQIDPGKLPVSIQRIRGRLTIASATKGDGLRIQETIEVVGVAPKIQLWNPERAKLATGPVSYGAPTHKEFIDHVTPQEFKDYPFDINALVQWLMEQLAEKKTAE